MIVLTWLTPVHATTYTVASDGSGNFLTIQAAVDACQNGDVVQLTDGTFSGLGNRDIHFDGKAITVRSVSGNPFACFIDCEGATTNAHRGFEFGSEGPSSVLDGIGIANGFEYAGGAIRCDYASPTIINCAFWHNTSTDSGGAIYCDVYTQPTIRRCTFIENQAEWGGGLCI
jgi:predicted outer membrane repeat protein